MAIDPLAETDGQKFSTAIGQHQMLAERCEAISQYFIVFIGAIVAAYGIYFMATNAVGSHDFNLGLILTGSASLAIPVALMIVNLISWMRHRKPAEQYCFSFNVHFPSSSPKAAKTQTARQAVSQHNPPPPVPPPAPAKVAPSPVKAPPSEEERLSSLENAQDDKAAKQLIQTFLPSNRCTVISERRLHAAEARFPAVIIALIQENRETSSGVSNRLCVDLLPLLRMNPEFLARYFTQIQRGDHALFVGLKPAEKQALFLVQEIDRKQLLQSLLTSGKLSQQEKALAIQAAPKEVVEALVTEMCVSVKDLDLTAFCALQPDVQKALLKALDAQLLKQMLSNLFIVKVLSENAIRVVLSSAPLEILDVFFGEKLAAFEWRVIRTFKLLSEQFKKDILKKREVETKQILKAIRDNSVLGDTEILKVTSAEIVVAVIVEEMATKGEASSGLFVSYCECLSAQEKTIFFEIFSKTAEAPTKKSLFDRLALREGRWQYLVFDWELSLAQFSDLLTLSDPEKKQRMFWSFFSCLTVEKMKLVLNKLQGPQFQKFIKILVFRTTRGDVSAQNRSLIAAFQEHSQTFVCAIAEILSEAIKNLDPADLKGIKNLNGVIYLRNALKIMPTPLKEACLAEVKRVLGGHAGYKLLSDELNK